MKKLLPLILILGFMFPIQPANAIFGLSKCEKVIKSLNKEQQVGFAQWETLNYTRTKALEPINYGSIVYAKDVINLVLLVFQSDLNIYKNIEKNSNCFKSEKVADNRSHLAETQRWIKALNQDWMSNLNKLRLEKLDKDNYKTIMGWYSDYYDWKTLKKINK